jgi:3-polyprenyl-4-hydroxybenzoate decarboxylase
MTVVNDIMFLAFHLKYVMRTRFQGREIAPPVYTFDKQPRRIQEMGNLIVISEIENMSREDHILQYDDILRCV